MLNGEITSWSAKCTVIFFPQKLFKKTAGVSPSCVSLRDFYFQDSLFFLTPSGPYSLIQRCRREQLHVLDA